MSGTDVPMFDPPLAGLPAESWDEVEAEAAAALPKCATCDRPLRSAKSRAAGIGPGCAAKIGRAVVAKRRSRQ